MKAQRSAIILGVMVAVLLVWLVVRSRVSGPSAQPTAGNVATATPAPSSAGIPATRTPPPATPAASSTPTASVLTPAASAMSTPPATASPSVSPNSSAPPAADANSASSELASINAIKVRRMITDYHTLTGENPVGTNAEIMAAVMGKNPRQATLGPPDGLSLNTQGELVDDWGTPYFFHQLSRDVMEIHSAGPDKIMGTSDDVIVR